jgi:RNA polymerase sigma-70 factor (ECF subfamily)
MFHGGIMSHAALLTDRRITGIHLSMTDDRVPLGRSARDETDLVHRIRQGETERFAELIDRYQAHVGRIVGRRVPPDRVREVIHDVFVRAYVHLAQFSDAVPFSHWLAGIAVRTCYDFWRSFSRKDVPVTGLSEEHQRWVEQTLAARSEEAFRDQTAKREATAVLDWALRQLSPENRAVLTLVHLDGYSVREAAELLGWSLVNVKVRAHRARQALRALLRHTLVRRSHGT